MGVTVGFRYWPASGAGWAAGRKTTITNKRRRKRKRTRVVVGGMEKEDEESWRGDRGACTELDGHKEADLLFLPASRPIAAALGDSCRAAAPPDPLSLPILLDAANVIASRCQHKKRDPLSFLLHLYTHSLYLSRLPILYFISTYMY